jgi:hypothetical protein
MSLSNNLYLNELILCDPCNTQCANPADNQGTNDANNQGTNDASNLGTNDADNQGTNDASNLGTNDADNQGTNDANNPGTNDANNPGTNDADNPGTNDANNPGTNDADNPGTNDANNPGTNDADNLGTNDANNPGTNDANNPGTNDANNPGTNDANNPGTNDADNLGTNDGDNQGTNDGDNQGINDGDCRLDNNNITLLSSLCLNWLNISILMLCLYLISDNYLLGISSYLCMFLIAYLFHLSAHKYDTLFTVLHRYHHMHNNTFSHLIQLLMELSIPLIFYPIYYVKGKVYLDVWVILFSVLLYSSVHNINYGYFRVNNVHSLHHKYPFSNLGPDVCDILFGSKHRLNTFAENTNHHIPNMILISILILCLRCLLKLNYVSISLLLRLLNKFLLFGGISCVSSSLYLFLSREKDISLHSLFTRESTIKHY